jgi:mannose-6-phosphate isomerase-like protein (cupin superfamily)
VTQTHRPAPVGRYGLLQDFENQDLSVRILRMDEGDEAIGRHVHQRCAQVYVVLQGYVAVERSGKTVELGPYEVASVGAGVPHSARPLGGPAVVMNISTPPLAADDQIPELGPITGSP